jgi:rubrerythrin
MNAPRRGCILTDTENIIAALNLEYGANRRYGYQLDHSVFPRLNAILEGIRRTEGDHIEAMLGYLKRQALADPSVGRGLATILTHLRLNLAFERQALEAYNRFAREADEPELKRTFQALAHAEAGHIKLFADLIGQIEANAFPVAVYCPICGWEVNFGPDPDDGTSEQCAVCKARVTLRLEAGDFVPAVAPRTPQG